MDNLMQLLWLFVHLKHLSGGKKKIHVCSYKAVVLAVKFARTGEEHGASRHVDAHGERLCGKQRLGGEQKHEQTLRPSHDFSSYIINKSLHFVLFLFRCLKPARTHICIFCIIYIYKRSSSSSMTLCWQVPLISSFATATWCWSLEQQEMINY